MTDTKSSVYLGRFYLNTSKGGQEYIKGRLGAATVLGWIKRDQKGDRVVDMTLVNDEKKDDSPRTGSDRAPAADSFDGDTIPF